LALTLARSAKGYLRCVNLDLQCVPLGRDHRYRSRYFLRNRGASCVNPRFVCCFVYLGANTGCISHYAFPSVRLKAVIVKAWPEVNETLSTTMSVPDVPTVPCMCWVVPLEA
jgi:hypothetical protein